MIKSIHKMRSHFVVGANLLLTKLSAHLDTPGGDLASSVEPAMP
jgi:hypothetical protein